MDSLLGVYNQKPNFFFSTCLSAPSYCKVIGVHVIYVQKVIKLKCPSRK